MNQYDIVIVGAGTAGLTAGIYAVRAGKTALVLDGQGFGGQIINTPEVENYPGIKKISGYEFANGLYEQASNLGTAVKFEQVSGMEKRDGYFVVRTGKNEFAAKAVILATGAKNRPLGLDRETQMIGAGVSYCATCDGMFFRGKTTAVVGGGNTALEDAAFLSDICEKVYLIHRRDEFRGDQKQVQLLKEKDNVEFLLSKTVTDLAGDGRLSHIEVMDVVSHETEQIPVDGLFVAVGQMPDNAIFAEYVKLDPAGYIVAGEDCKTSSEGIFAAGDCRTKNVRQLTTAAADGAVAALAACSYLNEQR